MKVEVFKTNVQEQCHADLVTDSIHKSFAHYKANFDLQDCDRILRVESPAGLVHPSPLIGLVKALGFHAEILSDEIFEIHEPASFGRGALNRIQNLLLARPLALRPKLNP